MFRDIPLVIFAGGSGTRLREETTQKPKPMVEIGGRPILWHIMKLYAQFGVRKFIICVGYKGDDIRNYFLSYKERNSDFTINLGSSEQLLFHSQHLENDWEITIAETGYETLTGARLKKVEKYIHSERFFCTYGDGLSDINISALLEFHLKSSKIGTLTAVKPQSRFGNLVLNAQNSVENFSEKPVGEGWINGGFFIFEKSFFKYLNMDDALEANPLTNLSMDGELGAFKHEGYWQPMDTYREKVLLEQLWNTGQAPWKTW